MNSLESTLQSISDWVWGPPLLILLFGTHLFLTFRLRFIQRYQQDLLSMMGHGAGQHEITQIIAGITGLIAAATAIAALLITPVLIALFQPLLPWTDFRLGDAIAPIAAILASLLVALLSARKAIAAFGPEAVFRS